MPLTALRSQLNLTAEQLTAVQDTVATINKQMAEKADAGDPATQKAMELLVRYAAVKGRQANHAGEPKALSGAIDTNTMPVQLMREQGRDAHTCGAAHRDHAVVVRDPVLREDWSRRRCACHLQRSTAWSEQGPEG